LPRSGFQFCRQPFRSVAAPESTVLPACPGLNRSSQRETMRCICTRSVVSTLSLAPTARTARHAVLRLQLSVALHQDCRAGPHVYAIATKRKRTVHYCGEGGRIVRSCQAGRQLAAAAWLPPTSSRPDGCTNCEGEQESDTWRCVRNPTSGVERTCSGPVRDVSSDAGLGAQGHSGQKVRRRGAVWHCAVAGCCASDDGSEVDEM
jgi:hypothetical protein